jgi:hypothetical protein
MTPKEKRLTKGMIWEQIIPMRIPKGKILWWKSDDSVCFVTPRQLTLLSRRSSERERGLNARNAEE